MVDISARMRQGIERVNSAMKGIPDRVPVYAQLSHHAARIADNSVFDFYTDPQVFIDSELIADEFYGFDLPTFHYDVYNIEAEAMGAKMLWKENECPETDPVAPLFESITDFTNSRPVNFGKSGRMQYVTEINRRLIDLGLSPKIRFCGPFSLAAKLIGIEKLIISILSEPDRVHCLMKFLTDEILSPWINYQRERAGSDETAIGADALASPPITTIPIVEEFCLNYIMRIEQNVGKIRLAGIWGESVLKNPSLLLDIKRKGYPSMLQALDPDVSILGPSMYKKYTVKHNMNLTMGLDAGLIQAGPVLAIKQRATEFLESSARDGRFIMYMNDIPYNTPPEHVQAVVEVAHNFA
jgi:uroporphyrinogen-III decarboxylase